MSRLQLVAACDRCAALCCTHLAFDASPAFSFSKPAGTACSHLAGNRCSIHARLVACGFAGCAAYDCHGAGPRATQLLAQGALGPREEHDVFAVLRDIHELLWIVDGMEAMGVATSSLFDELDGVASLPAAELLALDLAPYRARVRALGAQLRR